MNRFDLVLVFSYCLALLYIVAGIRGRLPGPKLLRLAVIPGFAGLALLAYLLWRHGAQTAGVVARALAGPQSIAMAAAAALGAGAVAHFLFTWCLDTPLALVRAVRRGRASGALTWLRTLVLAAESAVMVVALAVVLRSESRPGTGGQVLSSVPGLVSATRMPWLQFAELPEEDLVTLWNYLGSGLRAAPGGG